jgi:hypothetical protein
MRFTLIPSPSGKGRWRDSVFLPVISAAGDDEDADLAADVERPWIPGVCPGSSSVRNTYITGIGRGIKNLRCRATLYA